MVTRFFAQDGQRIPGAAKAESAASDRRELAEVSYSLPSLGVLRVSSASSLFVCMALAMRPGELGAYEASRCAQLGPEIRDTA